MNNVTTDITHSTYPNTQGIVDGEGGNFKMENLSLQ